MISKIVFNLPKITTIHTILVFYIYIRYLIYLNALSFVCVLMYINCIKNVF